MGICGALVYAAGKTTTATNIGLIYAVSPVIIILLTRAMFGERLSRRQMRSEEHTSELQSLMRISYAVFCLKTKNELNQHPHDLPQSDAHTLVDTILPNNNTI